MRTDRFLIEGRRRKGKRRIGKRRFRRRVERISEFCSIENRKRIIICENREEKNGEDEAQAEKRKKRKHGVSGKIRERRLRSAKKQIVMNGKK